jgi:hypothetical protein
MSPSDEAWNNFVQNSLPSAYDRGSERWAAALANLFMNLANSGGINAFLTSTYEIASGDVVEALSIIGAVEAAEQLEKVFQGIGAPLVVASQEERWDMLERYWTADLDGFDVLTDTSDAELMAVLAAHVAKEQDFYATLRNPSKQATKGAG